MDSILTSIKSQLGITEQQTSFDDQLIIHINSVFSILTQLGVGPKTGFSINDKNDKWDNFISDLSKIRMVKTYVYLKVRMIFDPPTSSSVIEAIKQSINELEFRLNAECDQPSQPEIQS